MKESFASNLADHKDAALALALALASLAVYLHTLAPDVVDADGGEFQLAAWNFSLVHPTGYPLYLILGGLFEHLLPVGNPAFRLNVFTALTAAMAVGAVYLAAAQATRHSIGGVGAAAAFALTRTFWFDASAAETYDLNAFFLACLLFIALRWQAQPDLKKALAFSFVYGLALTHHRTILLWLPAFAVFAGLVLRQARGKTRVDARRLTGDFGRMALFLLVPMLLYLYIPLRGPSSPYATLDLAPGRAIVLYDNSLAGIANYLLGRVFQYELGWDALSQARLASLPQLLLEQFGGLGIALGLFGLGVMTWRREWERLALLILGFVGTVLFAAAYHIGDILHYFIPAYLVWAIWVGAGLTGLVELVSAWSRSRATQFAAVGLVAVMAVLQLSANVSTADRSRETQPRDRWMRVLTVPIPERAVLISNDRDEMMSLWYIQYVEDRRRDLLGLFPLITSDPQYENVVKLIDTVLGTGRPVFLAKPMPGIEVKFQVAPDGPIIRVEGSAIQRPPQYPSKAVLDARLRVLGYDVSFEPGRLKVTIYWQPVARLDQDYISFIHLVGAQGKVAQGNDHQVGGDYYPTSSWEAGETLRDEQVIELPPGLASGPYRLVAGMYHYPDMEMLGEPVDIGAVQIR